MNKVKFFLVLIYSYQHPILQLDRVTLKLVINKTSLKNNTTIENPIKPLVNQVKKQNKHVKTSWFYHNSGVFFLQNMETSMDSV